MKILLLGGGLQGLSCAASLRSSGYRVDVVSDGLQVRQSKLFGKVYIGLSEYTVANVLPIVVEGQYDVIIPMGDKETTFLSKNRDAIEEKCGVKCASPDYEVLSIVEDKQQFMAFCETNNVPHPVTRKLSVDCLESSAMEVGFPALIKPDFSVGARGITRVNCLEELRDKFSSVCNQYGSCTLQELIANEEYYFNVMLYRTKSGDYPAFAISKIVRMYPVHAGSSSCLVTVENDELLNVCKDCLDKLNWVGMADFDVLQRLDNMEYKIIEINARVPASLRAAAMSGVNFPELIALDAVGHKAPTYEYQSGKTLRYMGIDMMWLLRSPSRFKSNPCWLKFFGRNVYYQDIYANDASTWWTWLAEGLLKVTRRNRRIR